MQKLWGITILRSLFKKAYRTFVENEMFIAEYNEFCRKNLDWVYDAAFYFAEKDKGKNGKKFHVDAPFMDYLLMSLKLLTVNFRFSPCW